MFEKFRQRSLEPENLDKGTYTPEEYEGCLVELRRVTRRGGALLVLDSPVFRRRPDGEAMVEQRMKEHGRRYGLAVPRETQSGYLVLGELPGMFRSAGWRLELRGWPHSVREHVRDLVEVLSRGRRTARFPILLARRDG